MDEIFHSSLKVSAFDNRSHLFRLFVFPLMVLWLLFSLSSQQIPGKKNSVLGLLNTLFFYPEVHGNFGFCFSTAISYQQTV